MSQADTRMEQNILEKILQGSMEPTDLPLELLRDITDGFSTNRIIGEGGFGTVYKGVVGKRNVAVKRIRSSMTIDDKFFRREVNSLMEVNHENVVRFLGLCSHTIETPMKNPGFRGCIFAEIRERLLCFEYISNGSLDKRITDELRGLEWDKRYEIIKGICTGLHYLHMEKRILHMDLKPANILLDNDMLPKIADFGLSRPEENSQTTSTPFVTIGYCAPENHFGRGRMSVQSDIYSLGVIIIELVTGNKDIPDTSDNILRRWRHRWNKSEKETSLKYHEQVTTCIEIGSLCQKVDPYARPSISEIMRKFVELESMDSFRKSAQDSMASQIQPPYWEDDMLGVEPLELQFANSGNDKQLILSSSLELSNDTDSFIAFKIHMTSPLPYSIEPNKGIVKPRTKSSVTITLPAANAEDHNKKKYTKGFIVQSIKVNEGLTTNDMNEEVFDNIKGQHVDEIYLSVIPEEPCNEEVTDSPTNQAKQYTSSAVSRTAKPIKPGSVQLVMNSSAVAPLLEYKTKVMLELTGGDYTSDRPGLDLVVVVELSEWYRVIKQVKTAMRFLVRKLSPMDRLSVIIFDNEHVWELWPLLQITEASSRRELEDLISTLEGGCVYNGLQDALQAGLNVLADREVRFGRVAAIMLVSSVDVGDAALVDVGDVPVYAFFPGHSVGVDPGVLHRVASKSLGGTFSRFMEKTGGLTMAFSQCLAGLQSVAVQNLELTVAAVRGESKIVKVTAGSYPQAQELKRNGGSSVTVRFGNLYSAEVRKVIVELLLPAIHSDHSAEILNVTYSHDRRPAGRFKLVAPAETVTLWRTGVEFSEEEKPAGLLSEEARLQTAQMVNEARTMADCNRLDDANDKLVEALNVQYNTPLLRTEQQELFFLFYREMCSPIPGYHPYTLSWELCQNRQRCVWACGMQWFSTPRMDKYLQQANKFLKEPTMQLSAVDDNVKEEVGALTVDVASRAEEMRRLALEVVRMRPPPPPVNSSRRRFRMAWFNKK